MDDSDRISDLVLVERWQSPHPLLLVFLNFGLLNFLGGSCAGLMLLLILQLLRPYMLIVGLVFWVNLRLEGEIALLGCGWWASLFDEKVSLYLCGLLQVKQVCFLLKGRGLFALARLVRDYQLTVLSACFYQFANLFFVRIGMCAGLLLLDRLFLQLRGRIACLFWVLSVRAAFLLVLCRWAVGRGFGIVRFTRLGMVKFHLMGNADD